MPRVLARNRRRRIDDLLDHMVAVGRTTAQAVRVWVRSSAPGAHRLEISKAVNGSPTASVSFHVPGTVGRDLTHATTYPDDFPGSPPLSPSTAYKFTVTNEASGAAIGSGRFETAPTGPATAPDSVAIAVMSCHQPFNSDGEVSELQTRTLRVLEMALNQAEVRWALLTGDQMYADEPGKFSVSDTNYARTVLGKNSILDFDAPRVRRIYQQRYRAFWNLAEIQLLYANRPTYPILDDHEILDDWGSVPEHRDPQHANLHAGAREAYFDYQGSRVSARGAQLPASFHYDFDDGYVGTFVMDIRSERYAAPGANQIYSKAQWADFDRFLARSGDKSVILVVSSVPVLHLPRKLTDLGGKLAKEIDFRDHWSLAGNVAARDRLLTRLIAHQRANRHQKIVLVGGDVHLSCALEIRFPNLPPMFQFTASSLSNHLAPLGMAFAKRAPALVDSVEVQTGAGPLRGTVSLLRPSSGSNPYAEPNVGIVRLRKRGREISFQLSGHSGRQAKLVAVPVFRSQWYA